MAKKYYGFFRAIDCYHESPNCPVVKSLSRHENIHIEEYETEREAVAGGHTRRCRVCMGFHNFKVPSLGPKDNMVRLTESQMIVLTLIVKQFEKGGPMTVAQVAAKRDRSQVATYIIIKKLISIGMAQHKVEPGHAKAKNGSIMPTDLGLKVVRMAQKEEFYQPV